MGLQLFLRSYEVVLESPTPWPTNAPRPRPKEALLPGLLIRNWAAVRSHKIELILRESAVLDRITHTEAPRCRNSEDALPTFYGNGRALRPTGLNKDPA